METEDGDPAEPAAPSAEANATESDAIANAEEAPEEKQSILLTSALFLLLAGCIVLILTVLEGMKETFAAMR